MDKWIELRLALIKLLNDEPENTIKKNTIILQLKVIIENYEKASVVY
tara:strand:- start:1111 stop:1251 length:141 start_codon:yes stop_codon:yes gene_type:complete